MRRMTSHSQPPSIVLVHGAWHGAWCWRRVLPVLRAAGATVHAVTLTGVGDRSHLLTAVSGVETHVQDVLALIEAEELASVVLVGHSYGGLVVTGVADALLAQSPERLHSLVYVDAVVPHSGESWSSTHTPETIQARLNQAEASGGLSFPPPDASVFGLDGADRDWVNRRQTSQPLAVYRSPLKFDEAAVARVPRLFIDCTSPALPTIAVSRERVRTQAGWQVRALATGHDPMVSEPQALADILLKWQAQGQ
jgi:pimeloyl-ACP methyl ester carboxylesterase